jgi:catechol 2,3-dioxygenase-like lactoylglutathione lyase family enzyme
MKFQSPVIFVKDIEISKDFYCRLLTQEIESDFGKNIIFKSGFALWQPDRDHTISLKLDPATRSQGFELYFEDENLEAIYEKLSLENVSFLHGIREENWGQRTLRFFDPDGHLIEIGEPLEVFILNMKRKGLEPEEISSKTGMDVGSVTRLLELFESKS